MEAKGEAHLCLHNDFLSVMAAENKVREKKVCQKRFFFLPSPQVENITLSAADVRPELL